MENKRGFVKQVVFGFMMMIILVGLDQVTKFLAIKHLKDQPSMVWIKGVFELQYLENRGAAFGLFQDQKWMFILSVIIVVVIVSYCFYRLPLDKQYMPLRWICIGMLSGAIGNMIDRLVHGFVVDFFYFSLIDFPIFNIADIYVVLSSVFLILLVFFYYKEEDFSFLLPGRKKS